MTTETRGTTWIMGWAVLGVAATFVEAIVRLGARAGAELSRGLSAGQWAALVVLTIAMTYIEGHHALHRRFAPSVISRAQEVAVRQRTVWNLLAPLYAVSLIGAPRAVIMRSAFGVTMIVICVFSVRSLPSPWRGIVDAAVATALAWGLIALLARFALALASRAAETPEPRHASLPKET